MRIFLTGATGFIGSHVIPQLLEAGHQVLGLTRSDAGAKQLAGAGAEVHRGDLEDPSTLRRGAEKADAVIHCAFDHDFSRFVDNCEKDRRNIEAMGEALAGSKRPLIITSGTGIGSRVPGQLASEDVFDATHPNPRKISEETGAAVAARGVNVSYVRLPQVHDTRKQGLISPLIEISRAKGRVAYLGEGKNRWAAGHVSDVARLYKLAIERAEPGARYNAVGEEGVTAKAHRRGARSLVEAPGGEPQRRRGGGVFRLDGHVRRVGHAGVERHHPEEAGMDAGRTGAHRRLGRT